MVHVLALQEMIILLLFGCNLSTILRVLAVCHLIYKKETPALGGVS